MYLETGATTTPASRPAGILTLFASNKTSHVLLFVLGKYPMSHFPLYRHRQNFLYFYNSTRKVINLTPTPFYSEP